MERIQSVPDEKIGLSSDTSTLPNNNIKYEDYKTENGSSIFERLILDENSYWIGLNNRLSTASIDSIETNLPNFAPNSDPCLGKKLGALRLVQGDSLMDGLHKLFLDASENLDRLKSTVEEQFQNLEEELDEKTLNSKDKRKINERIGDLGNLLKLGFNKISETFELINASVSELQWVSELQEEVSNIAIWDAFRGLKDEFETRICKQRSVMKALNEHWQEKVREFDLVRKELHEFSKSLINPENTKNVNSEERIITKFKDNVRVGSLEDLLPIQKEENGQTQTEKFENTDFAHVKHLTKDEIISYFRTQLINMRRQHDVALQEKTEELFRYKRENPKGLLFFKKDKECESLRKRISDIIVKLDEIRSKKIEVFVVSTDHDDISRLRGRVDSLYCENQRLRSSVTDKKKELDQLSYKLREQDRKLSVQSAAQAGLNLQIEKLGGKCNELEIEGKIRDEIHSTFLEKMAGDFSKRMEDMDLKARGILVNCQEEKSSLENMILEKDRSLLLANEESRKLKWAINSFLESMDGAKNFTKKEDQFAKNNLENSVKEFEMESGSLNLENLSTSLEELGKKNFVGRGENLGSVIISIMKLSKVFSEMETKLSSNITRSENRLQAMIHQCDPLVQEVTELRKRSILYKEILEIKQSELQNTESEVDFLLNFLQKMYTTLGYFSPVLEHSPGLLDTFMKTCNLITSLKRNQFKDRYYANQSKLNR